MKDWFEFHPLKVEIEERPLNPFGRFLMWIFFIIIIFSCFYLYFGKIDIVVSSRGTVIPIGEIKTLQPIEKGVISGIFVKEGDFVKKGDLLLQIDPSIIEINLEEKENRLNLLFNQKNRLISLVEFTAFHCDCEEDKVYYVQNKNYLDSIFSYEKQLEQIKLQLNQSNIELQDYNNLYINSFQRLEKLKSVIDIVAKKDVFELEKETNSLKNKISIQKLKYKELDEKYKEVYNSLIIFKNDFKDKKLEEYIEKEKEYKTLKAEIDNVKIQNQKQSIISPVNGKISKIFIHTIGGVVSPAEELINIVPSETELIVKSEVLNQDIGFIKNGLDVKIKTDTFNFQKYGFFEGNVINVSPFSTEDEKKGSYYEIKIKPSNKFIVVDGVERYLEPGMSVTSEIKVGKRRIIEFFIYPLIQNWNEGMSIR